MDKKLLPRDAAASFTLPPGGTGPITEICKLHDRLEVYKVDATFMVQTPNSVDPLRTNPNALWVNAKVDDVGSNSLAVARTFIMASQVLKIADFDPPVDSMSVLSQMHRIKGTLVLCERVANQYNDTLKAELDAVESTGFRLTAGGRALERFPVLNDLDLRTTTFLINAKRAVQEVCALVCMFWTLDKHHSRFDQLVKDVERRLGVDNRFVKFINEYVDRVSRIVELRNFQEHGTALKRLQVENFRLMPTNQIRAPVWYIDGENPCDISSDMDAIASLLIELAENVFVGCVDQRLSGRFPLCFEYIETPDPTVPVRYRLTIDSTKLVWPSEVEVKPSSNIDSKN
jgi:hypothetical protein